MEWASRTDSFEDKKRAGRLKILNDAATGILKKAKYKRGKLDQAALTTISKQRPCWAIIHHLEVYEK